MCRRLQPYVPEAAALCIQVAFADRLLLNKTDLVTADDLIRVGARLLLATYYLLLTTHYSLRTTYYSLLTSVLLPTPYSLLPTSYLLPPTSYLLLPTSYFLRAPPYIQLTANLLLTYYSVEARLRAINAIAPIRHTTFSSVGVEHVLGSQ